jgi:hypothetical protein
VCAGLHTLQARLQLCSLPGLWLCGGYVHLPHSMHYSLPQLVVCSAHKTFFTSATCGECASLFAGHGLVGAARGSDLKRPTGAHGQQSL